jgi:TrkA domain protein
MLRAALLADGLAATGTVLRAIRSPCEYKTAMANIDETRLPGLGLRHDFQTSAGARIGVITYRDGRRELLLFDERDPDECRASVTLDDEDARALADLLGGSQIIEHIQHEHRRGDDMTTR